MNHIKLSVITLVSLLLLLYLHIQGMAQNLYLNYWYYDVVLHFFGGICIALSAYCVTEFFNIQIIKRNFWSIILLTFIAGFAWEVFEVIYDIAGHHFGTLQYNIDSIKDLINDVIGGAVVYFMLKNKI